MKYHILTLTGLLALCLAVPATFSAEPPVPATKPALALPTKAQLEWADLEFGMFIHGPSASHAEELAECAARMGARYVLIVAKHNNGYIHWHSKTAVRIGVQKDGKPDNVGAVVAEARKRNLKIGFYNVPADWGDGVGDGGICADPVRQEAWRKSGVLEYQFRWEIKRDGTLQLCMTDDTGDRCGLGLWPPAAAPRVSAGRWCHVALTRDGSDFQLFLDGTPIHRSQACARLGHPYNRLPHCWVPIMARQKARPPSTSRA